MRKPYEHTVMPFLEADENVRNILDDHYNNVPEEIEPMDVHFVNQKITAHFGVTESFTNIWTRKREVVYPRQLVHFFSKLLTKNSYREIGVIGPVRHCTAVHSVRTVRDLYKTDHKYRDEIREIAMLFNVETDELEKKIELIPE